MGPRSGWGYSYHRRIPIPECPKCAKFLWNLEVITICIWSELLTIGMRTWRSALAWPPSKLMEQNWTSKGKAAGMGILCSRLNYTVIKSKGSKTYICPPGRWCQAGLGTVPELSHPAQSGRRRCPYSSRTSSLPGWTSHFIYRSTCN